MMSALLELYFADPAVGEAAMRFPGLFHASKDPAVNFSNVGRELQFVQSTHPFAFSLKVGYICKDTHHPGNLVP
jgi:hypothetical protein